MGSVISDDQGNDFMDLEEFRKRVGMGRTAVYQAARDGALPLKVHRFGRRYLISRVEYDAVLQGRSQPSASGQSEKGALNGN